MTVRGRCRLVAYDFEDVDVYWNIRLFYECSGFRIVEADAPPPDLLVVQRGDPGRGHPHRAFSGTVHVYDYVKELTVDWRERFPAAREVVVISLSPPRLRTGITFIEGYLPILPSLWQLQPFRKRLQRPLHIANFKPMPEDSYQRQLLTLARHGLIRVYGRRWEQADLRTDGVSYWRANQLLASAHSCYGLMYPYQRGRTLSGRMWQAPLQGCFVISEAGTNPFACPGVIEVERFDPDSLLRAGSILECWHLRREATAYWQEKTRRLGEALDLEGSPRISRRQHDHWRRQMLRSHRRQQWQQGQRQLTDRLIPLPLRCRWRRAGLRLQSVRRRLGRGSVV